MARFWNKEPRKSFMDEYLEKNPIETYSTFTEEELDFIGHAETTVLESDIWYQNQLAFIDWIRRIDFDASPNWQGYKDVEDWKLAFLMDVYFIIDMELVAKRTHTDEIDLNLDDVALNFISKIYLSRAIAADGSDPSVMLKTALDLIENKEEINTLRTSGSMFRWLK